MIHAELEVLKTVAFCIVIPYLWRLGVTTGLRNQRGWSYMLAGCGVVLTGLLVGVTEAFPGLSRFVVIGNGSYEPYIKSGVIFPLGYILIAVGVGKLLPFVTRLAEADAKLRRTLLELEDRVRDRTADLVAANELLQREAVERRSVEVELRQSEEKYRLIFEHSPLGVFHLDETGTITACNDNFVRIIGSSRETLIGLNTIRDIRDQKMIAAIKRALSGELGHYEDYYSSVTAGKTTPVKCEFAPILSQGGGVTGGIGIVENITDRRRAEEALRESEDLFRLAFQTGPDPVSISSLKDGMYVDVNDGFTTMTGYSREEAVGKSSTELDIWTDPEDRRRLVRALQEYGHVQNMETKFHLRDGRVKTGLMSARVFTLKGEPHLLAIVRDIEEWKRTQEALRESEERYRAIFNNAAAGISLTDSDGRFIQVNSTSARIYGYTQEELLGLTFYDITHPDDVETSRQEVLPLQHGQKDSYRLEKRYVRKDGKVIWAEISVSALRDARGEYAATLAVTVDITERKKSEQERESLQKQLLQAQKMEAIGTLAGGIAHDFNNLLQIILGYTELLLVKKEPDDPDRKRLEVIHRAARDGADLVARILTFSRKAESKARPMDLNDEIRRVEKLLRRTLPRMIQIDLLLADDLRIIDADPAQIEQVILNLGVNAQHALPEGGRLTIETRNVSLTDAYVNAHLAAKPGEYVLLTVSDTGLGMPPEVLDRIFEPFFTTKTNGEGTGLGLAMVHGIVAQHGGYVSCYSEPGMGTSFKMYFPVSSAELRSDSALTREMPAGGSETVLLVDDDDRVREMGRQVIEMGGYNVLVAQSGEEALVKYSEHKEEISLVILDLIMPGMGGKVCLEEILRINPDARIILASGYSSDALTHHKMGIGARGFIIKPYDAKCILDAIRKVLDHGEL